LAAEIELVEMLPAIPPTIHPTAQKKTAARLFHWARMSKLCENQEISGGHPVGEDERDLRRPERLAAVESGRGGGAKDSSKTDEETTDRDLSRRVRSVRRKSGPGRGKRTAGNLQGAGESARINVSDGDEYSLHPLGLGRRGVTSEIGSVDGESSPAIERVRSVLSLRRMNELTSYP